MPTNNLIIQITRIFWSNTSQYPSYCLFQFYIRVTRIIRTSPRALIFGAFGLVVLARLISCVVLRTQNYLKIKALWSEIFWLTNIRQQQENADDSILIHSRRLTNWWRIIVAKKLVRIILVTLNNVLKVPNKIICPQLSVHCPLITVHFS